MKLKSSHTLRWIVPLFSVCLAALAIRVSAQQQPPERPARQGQDLSKVEITATPVAGNIQLLEGSGGNIGVSVGPDGLLIVDTQFLPLADKINAALKRLSPLPLQYVINTHIHGDHTGGNAYFGKQAHIIAHTNLRKRLAAKDGVKPEELPVITHEHGFSLFFNGEEIRILGFGPGHTDGDTAVYFTQSNVLQLGDQFVNGRFPYVDVVNGGDVRGLIKNLDSILAWLPADAKVIPGHGKVSTVADLRNFRETIAETVAYVEKGIAAGQTSEQIKADAPLDKYKAWGAGPQAAPRWFDAVYNSLGKK
ncbi:MAG TPA: MBL fold metallo-hydrolase [Verrucomicrobiota bacterium]|nr:MBL fold metallo-hydrolase [Verrucomicrobiota bacterium]